MQDDGKATTSDMVAMQSHHAPSTHASTYFTHRKTHLEDYYDAYHFHLGDKDTQWTYDIPLDVLPEQTIVAALKILYGGEANWLSETQRSMVLTWSTLSKNVVANLPCGGGKSAVWEVTAYTRHRVGLTRKCTVVVVPYKFLAYNHYHSAEA
jgi:superfamily II DNA helicase RecQ